jgi:hypothetical protein
VTFTATVADLLGKFLGAQCLPQSGVVLPLGKANELMVCITIAAVFARFYVVPGNSRLSVSKYSRVCQRGR